MSVYCANIVSNKSNLHTERYRRLVSADVSAGKILVSKLMNRESKRRFTGLELAVCSGLVQKLALESEGLLEKLK